MDVSGLKTPSRISIGVRTSSITNAFVNGILPIISPTLEQKEECCAVLGIDKHDVRCSYCGDPATEWDHLRPLVKEKKPTGYITDIYNLVPACGKCNQSKGNKDWASWIVSDASKSPKSRGIQDIEIKINKLKEFEKWGQGKTKWLDFESLAKNEAWRQHWDNYEKLIGVMKESQKFSKQVKEMIEDHLEDCNESQPFNEGQD